MVVVVVAGLKGGLYSSHDGLPLQDTLMSLMQLRRLDFLYQLGQTKSRHPSGSPPTDVCILYEPSALVRILLCYEDLWPYDRVEKVHLRFHAC